MTRPSDRAPIEPKQERSRETLRRILAAARELVRDTVFEEVTVKSIAERAGCSVGNFYERFPNKEALVPPLLEIHYTEVEQRVAAVVNGPAGADLTARAHEVVDLLVGIAIEDRGLIRTLVLRNHQRPESIPPSIRKRAGRIVDDISAYLLADLDQVRHPHPELAARLGLLMVTATIRERLVLVGATQAATLDLGPYALSRELVTALTAYLTSSPVADSGGPS